MADATAPRVLTMHAVMQKPLDLMQENTPAEELNVPVVNLGEAYRQGLPDVAPELIKGVLRRGHKMLISAPSKAGKSFSLVELAIAIAEGQTWMGFKCRQGRVLYLNLEIDPPSFLNRLDRVYQEISPKHEQADDIDVLNLRGMSPNLDNLIPQIIALNRQHNYAAVVLDPIYKLMSGGDENAAGDIGKFCAQLDEIASRTGASVIYVHHYSKGAQGSKKAIDRASGSGVFGRDPDAVVTLSELDETENAKRWLSAHYEQLDPMWRDPDAVEDYNAIRQRLIDRVTSWRVEFVLREFATPAPLNVWFRNPVHIIDREGVLSSAAIVGEKTAQDAQREKFDEATADLEDAFFKRGEDAVLLTDLEKALGISRNTAKRRIEHSEKLELFTESDRANSPLFVRKCI